MKRLFNSHPKYLYVGPDKHLNGLFFSELSNPYKEGEEWKSGDDELMIHMMTRERHEQTESRQSLLPKVDFGALSDLNHAKIEDIGVGGFVWMGTTKERDEQFKKLGK